jgi:hypothetical protein
MTEKTTKTLSDFEPLAAPYKAMTFGSIVLVNRTLHSEQNFSQKNPHLIHRVKGCELYTSNTAASLVASTLSFADLPNKWKKTKQRLATVLSHYYASTVLSSLYYRQL